MMAEHTMRQTVAAELLDVDPTLRKHITKKLTDGLMKAVCLEACFGETIVSLGPIKESQVKDLCSVQFEESVTLTPLVRCRECEYWETSWVPNHYTKGEVHFCSIADKMTMGHYFCADGDRKSGGPDDG